MNSVIGNLKNNDSTWPVLEKDVEKLRQLHDLMPEDWNDTTFALFVAELMFANAWKRAGRPVYELSHSVAATFAITSPPELDWKHAPHEAMLISIPKSMFPVTGSAFSDSTYVYAWQSRYMVVPDWDTTSRQITFFGEQTDEKKITAVTNKIVAAGGAGSQGDGREAVLGFRYLSNLVAYITEYKESTEIKGDPAKSGHMTYLVKPPKDVVVTREFRDVARAWRNQAVGLNRAEHKMTWVKPHKRGNEDFGRVISRVLKV